MHLIYIIHNRQSGKRYVGQTSKTLATRWKWHVREALHPSPSRRGNAHFGAAIRKYGPDSFQILELARTEDKHEADALERLWIAEFGSHIPRRGYNKTLGGDGVVATPEVRAKMSAAKKGRKLSPEHRAKVIKALIGRKFSAETREKLRQSKLGNRNPNFGKKLSPTTIARRRATYATQGYPSTGRKLSAEHRQKVSEGLRRYNYFLKEIL